MWVTSVMYLGQHRGRYILCAEESISWKLLTTLGKRFHWQKATLSSIASALLAPFTLVSPVLSDNQCGGNFSLLSFSECYFSFVVILWQMSSFLPYLWGILWIFESEMLQGFFLASVLLVVPQIFVATFRTSVFSDGVSDISYHCCNVGVLFLGSFNCFQGEEMFFTQFCLSWHSFACLGDLYPSIFLKFGWEFAKTLPLWEFHPIPSTM